VTCESAPPPRRYPQSLRTTSSSVPSACRTTRLMRTTPPSAPARVGSSSSGAANAPACPAARRLHRRPGAQRAGRSEIDRPPIAANATDVPAGSFHARPRNQPSGSSRLGPLKRERPPVGGRSWSSLLLPG
jgi:hypothetical protein